MRMAVLRSRQIWWKHSLTEAEMRKFAHVGMPKTLSSALQSNFFSVHPDIYFLGIGVGSLIDYVDDDINIVFETLVPYANETYFQTHKEYYKNRINEHLGRARERAKSAAGVSSEWLGFNFTPEMADPELKTRRLQELMGNDCNIIFLVRNQWSYLKSLYAELVKLGLSRTYSEYCEYLWKYQDRSALYEMLYDQQLQRMRAYFHRENIHILALESYRRPGGELITNENGIALIQELCEILDTAYPKDLQFPRVNPSLDEKEVLQKLQLNREYRHDFGNLIFEPSNKHRSRKQLQQYKIRNDEDYFADVKRKRYLLTVAQEEARRSTERVDYKLPKNLEDNFSNLFRESNIRLEKQCGIRLPDEYKT